MPETVHAEAAREVGGGRVVNRPHCGTPYGYKLHVDSQEPTCAACREARRKQMAAYRSDPSVAALIAWESRTRYAALRMLARRYPAAFLQILDEVRAADPRPAAEAEAA